MALERTILPILPFIKSQLIAYSVVAFLAVLVVALRIVARLVTGSRLGWDDYLILAAVPQAIVILTCGGLWSTAGAGYPENAIPQENKKFIAVVFIPFALIYDMCIVTTKLSVLSFYLRVFTHGFTQQAARCMVVLVAIWGLANFLQSLLICHLHNGHFEIGIGQCKNKTASSVSSGIYNCTTNVIINCLPLFTIWSLKTVSVSTRLGLSGVFLLSLGVTLVSIIRMVRVIQAEWASAPLVARSEIALLTILEVSLSIFCNSLPMLLPLYSYWRYRRFYDKEEDEYVSRLGGNNKDPKNLKFVVEGVTNGLPLETIYGKDHVHFTATVGRGDMQREQRGERSSARSRGRTASDQSEDDWDAESTRRLPTSVGATGITIETKWVVVEEERRDTF